MTHEHPKHEHTSHEHKAAPEHVHAEKPEKRSGGRSILFLPSGNIGVASSRLICYENARYLRQRGWNVKVGKGNLEDFDFVIFQKRFTPRDRARLSQVRGKSILQISEARFISRGGAGALAFARQANALVVGTDYTQKWFAAKGVRSTVISTGLDFAALPRPEKEMPLKICWIGSRTNEPYLAHVVGPINRLWKDHDFEFRVITAVNPGLPFAKPINFIRWQLGVAERQVGECHIGIAPLTPASKEFTKPPSKPVLYMALGLAVIATDTPPYRSLIQSGSNGYLIPGNNPDRWYKALKVLVESASQREAIASTGNASCQSWNAPVIARKWDRFLRSL